MFTTSKFAIFFFFRREYSPAHNLFAPRRALMRPVLLALPGGLLRSLQRIDSTGSSKATALARRSLGLGNQHVALTRSRHCTLNHQQVLFDIDAANPQVTYRNLVRTHVPWHALPGKHARRKAGSADRTLHLEHMTVRLGSAAETVAAHNACKSPALRSTNHIDKLGIGEDIHQNAIPSLSRSEER